METYLKGGGALMIGGNRGQSYWINHIKAYMRENGGSYQNAIVESARTYKKPKTIKARDDRTMKFKEERPPIETVEERARRLNLNRVRRYRAKN